MLGTNLKKNWNCVATGKGGVEPDFIWLLGFLSFITAHVVADPILRIRESNL